MDRVRETIARNYKENQKLFYVALESRYEKAKTEQFEKKKK